MRARHQPYVGCLLRIAKTSEELTDQGMPFAQHPATTADWRCDVGQVISIDVLPDDILLPIFDYYLRLYSLPEEITSAWQLLAQVCRRWRSAVFGSPRRLDLRLCCTHRTRSRDMLDIWPALPLMICGSEDDSTRSRCVDNIVAVLKYGDRVCRIDLVIFGTLEWETYLAAMQQPFPELTRLQLWGNDEPLVVPDSVLGGFAPRLEVVDLENISFPGLPKLLLSATHLATLRVHDIPQSGYFSPDAMVAALSTLTSLELLWLGFKSPESCPDLENLHLPPSTRSVLPVLKYFEFKGVSEYLEDLVTDIDAPHLNNFRITFFNDIIFDIPQLIHFISRTPIPNALEKAHIIPEDSTASVILQSHDVELNLSILCEGLDWQLSSLQQICTSCLPFLSTLKHLYVHENLYLHSVWKDNVENRVWQELLHRFTTVKNLYMSRKLALRIGPALQELVRGRATEVLPTLENIFLEALESPERAQEGIGQFVAARQVSSHPVTISYWEKIMLDMPVIVYWSTSI